MLQLFVPKYLSANTCDYHCHNETKESVSGESIPAEEACSLGSYKWVLKCKTLQFTSSHQIKYFGGGT